MNIVKSAINHISKLSLSYLLLDYLELMIEKMKKYLVRVVLPQGSEEDFETLHSILCHNGYSVKLTKAGTSPFQIDLSQGQFAVAEDITSEHLFLRTKALLEAALPRNNVYIRNCTLFWGDLEPYPSS